MSNAPMMPSLHPDLFFPPLPPSPATLPPTPSVDTARPPIDVEKRQWMAAEKDGNQSFLPMYTVLAPPPAAASSSSSRSYRSISILLFASFVSLLIYHSRGTSVDFNVSWSVQPIPRSMRNEVPWYKVAVISLDVAVDVTTEVPATGPGGEERRRLGMGKEKVAQLEITASSYPLAVNKRMASGIRTSETPRRKQLGYATLMKQTKQRPVQLMMEPYHPSFSSAAPDMEDNVYAGEDAIGGEFDFVDNEEEWATLRRDSLTIQS